MTAKDDRQPGKKPANEKVRKTAVPVDADDVKFRKPLEWKLFARLLRYLGPYKMRLTGAVALVALSSAAMLVGVEACRQIIKAIRLGPDYRMQMLIWIGVLVVNALAGWQLNFFSEMRLVKLGQRVLLDLRMTIFRHLQRLSLSYYDRTRQGWIISRATSDLAVLEDTIAGTIPQLAWVVFLLIGGAIWALVRSPILFLVMLGVVPVMIAITFLFHGHLAGAWRNVRTQVSRICANLAENIAGVRVVQAFTRERRNLREFDRLNRRYYDARVRAAVVQSLYVPSIAVLTAAGTAAVILIVGWKIQTRDPSVNVEDLVGMLLMLKVFFEPIRGLSAMYGTTLGAMAAAERVFDLLDTEPDVKDSSGARILPAIDGHVRFDGVTFAYNEGEPVLSDISIEAKPGQTIALVGPTGAGKSSVINLLCRFYDPQEGEITVDGCDLRDVTMHSLRSQMGIVMQEPFLFSGTVMDNIKFGRPEATDGEVHDAARAIGAHDILAGLRDGYETQVQERGEGLSGGERQLVCFTRAMVADPRILVLDEATSSVDMATELRIQQALDHLVKRRTSFVVAHRLSTVRSADVVLVVRDGRIVERGTHAELIARDAEYARMYREFLREG